MTSKYCAIPWHLALTQNMPRLLNILLSTGTSMNSKSLLNHMVFPLKTYITWMRRDARGVVERRLAAGNIYILKDSVPSISIVVLILSLSQSLRLSVQMELSSNQASYFWAHLSVLNGLTAIQTLCMCIIIIIIICYKFLLTVQCCYISKRLDG